MQCNIAILAAGFLVIPVFAWAYVDLGTGSYIIQVLIGLFFAALVAVKHYWQRIRSWLSSSRRKSR